MTSMASRLVKKEGFPNIEMPEILLIQRLEKSIIATMKTKGLQVVEYELQYIKFNPKAKSIVDIPRRKIIECYETLINNKKREQVNAAKSAIKRNKAKETVDNTNNSPKRHWERG